MTAFPVGAVIVTGESVAGACAFPGVTLLVPLDESRTFFAFRTDVDETCSLRLAEACADVLACSALGIPVGISGEDLPVVVAGQAMASICTGQRSVKADYWTEGHFYGWLGAKNDLLTESVITLTYNYNCSSGSAETFSYTGDCIKRHVTGWHTHACYYSAPSPPSGATNMGVFGDFGCHRELAFAGFQPFCDSSNHWQHTLHVVARGYNNGNGACVFTPGGTQMPPYGPFKTCTYV